MAVEADGLPYDRHDAVGSGEIEQLVDVVVAQPGRDGSQGMLRVKFVGEQIAPRLLVRGERGGVETIVLERVTADLGGEGSAENAVLDAAARRRLHESGCVADDEQSVAVGARDRPERQ